jgi:hypothetical protein
MTRDVELKRLASLGITAVTLAIASVLFVWGLRMLWLTTRH